MARYAITILAITAIILTTAGGAGAAPPKKPRELTVLAYNTHLFEDSIFECICRCGGIPEPDKCTWGDYNYEDWTRRDMIALMVEASEADIVVLQEVWAPCWQQWFINQLAATYSYSATWDSNCISWDVLGFELQACLGIPLNMIDRHCCGDNCCAETYTLGNGLVLLSKFPLSNIGFERFPTFEQCSIGSCEAWSDKGVLTADVDVNGATIRIGVSHALGKPHDRSKWDTNYIGTAITPFQLRGEPYIFALDNDSNGHIVRMEDHGRSWDEKGKKYNNGAGWKHIHEMYWGTDYVSVTAFELDGHPYLFALNNSNKGRITRINDDPSTGWTHLHVDDCGCDYVAVTSFELDGHPYLFALDANEQAYTTRINDDPCTGWQVLYQGAWSPNDVNYVESAITSFELDGDPYIFTLATSGRAHVKRVNDDPCRGWIPVYEGQWGCAYDNVTSFELDGHPYLFGLYHQKILRINDDDPSQDWTYTYEAPLDANIAAWYRFEGDTYDSSGHGRNGTAYGGPTYSPDCRGELYSIKLDGVDDYVEVGDVGIDGDSPRTIAGWVRATKPAGQISGWTGIFGFTGTGGGNTHFDIERSGASGSNHYCIHVYGWQQNITELDQEWHHLAATYDGTTIAWYANGSRVGSEARVLDTNGKVQIGKREDNNNHFPGLVDDVRIYNRALSYDEISYLALGYTAVKSFEMNGHPYLFALRNCCDQFMDSTGCRPRPGEAYLKRINDDPCTGWEDLLQLEDIRIIRDETVVDEDGPPAIMMGDFNIHRDKYGIMDELFGKARAVDAYIEVHGSDIGGETGDFRNNILQQILCPPNDPCACDPNNHPLDRVDYVYFRQSGGGLRLVPTEAQVFRDWQYESPTLGTIDLSDHFPLSVKFKIFEGGCTARAKGDLNCDRLINFADLAILSSAWMSRPGDGAWDPACDISEPADSFIDSRDVDVIARAWLTMPVYNVTDNTWYGFIQRAIDDASDGDEIEVAPGTYYEAIDFKGKAIRLYSSGGPEVTTIDPKGIGGAYHVVKCVSGEGPNTILEGFTITGGNANGSDPNEKCGGGMYNYQSSPTVINCAFSGNTAANDGGGMYNLTNSSPKLSNCILWKNSASYGGGMYNHDNSTPAINNCTFSGNEATKAGGGILNNSSSNPALINSILWGNTPEQINDWDFPASTSTVSFSDVQGGVRPGPGNIVADPLFVDAARGDFRLLSSASSCVDAGDNNSVPCDTTDLDGDGNTTEPIPWDIAGNPRITDGDYDANAVVDIGAFELNGPVWNRTQNRLYSIIQAAIDDANEGDEIEVSRGTYNETINFLGKAVRLCSSDPNDPNVVTATIINGTGHFHVVQCVSGEGPNTKLEGFTITGGKANGGWPHNYGGGMLNHNGSSPTVTNCIFTVNSAGLGGGMYNNSGGSPEVTNCIFSGNSTTGSGGGMYNYDNSPKVTGCNFSGNSTTGRGGGMFNDSSSPTVTNSTFSGNSAATGGGGGMYNLTNSRPVVTGCNFTGNTAGSDGGGMDNRDSSEPNLTNCTFSNNSATGNGGGVNNHDSNTALTDCTFTGNTANYGGGMYNTGSSPTVADCNFNGNEATENGGGIYNDQSSSPVTNCNFTGNTADTDGGGMYNNDSSPMVIDCNFNVNEAMKKGGGIYNYQSSPTLDNCSFAGNTASGSGGGMYNNYDSYPTLANCTFTGNITGYNGGGIYVFSGAPSLTNCIFSGNSAIRGGGMYCWNPAYLNDCTFSNNSATENGGGMYNYQTYTCLLTNCTFSGNEATSDGGGMYNDQSSPTVTECTFGNNTATSGGGGGVRNWISSPTVTNCKFTGNSAQHAGGMFNDNGSSPMVTNCTFVNNKTTGIGGGMFNLTNSSPTLTNCTFSGNSAGSGGSGMDNRVSSNPNVTNCIIWGNEPNEIYNYSASPIVTYSDIQGSTGQPWFGTGCIDADPCFVNAENPDPNLWNLRLKLDSPCIDTGDNVSLPPDTADLDDDGDTTEKIPYDLDGNDRVWNGIVDMGSYEYLIPPPPISTADNFEYLAMICANWLAGTKPEL